MAASNSPAASCSTYTSLMRMNSSGRPYAKDMFDFFGAALLQIPLTDHRAFFRTYPATFTTEEGVAIFSNLKFTHIVRTPDPANSNRHVATRTTTTFSMSPEMAKSLGTHILEARLIENATDPQSRVMKDKGLWRPTPKGKFMIQEFAHRAHIDIKNMQAPLSRIESFKIFTFERLAEDDKLAFSRENMTNAFRMMMAWLPTEKLMADDVGGLKGRNLVEYKYCFHGYQAFEWISEYTTVVNRKEAEMIAAEFVLYGWISQVIDKSDRANSSKEDMTFKMTKTTLYHVTDRGRATLGWDEEPESEINDQASANSGHTSSSSDHTELLAKQHSAAKRLVITEEHTELADTVPAATITEQRQLATSSSSSSETTSNPAINVSRYGFSDASETQDPLAPTAALDEVTEKLLRLRASGKKYKPKETDQASSSQDSGFEVGGEDETVAGSGTRRSRPESVSEHHDDNEVSMPSVDIVGFSNQDTPRDSQWTRLRQILDDPLIRMYFRDFMKANFCDENINFWVDFYNLRKKCRARASSKELLSDAYNIYDNYLGPNAKYEVNIDHGLRQEIITLVSSTFSVVSSSRADLPFSSAPSHSAQMTVVVNGPSGATLNTLLRMYDRVNEHICRIMAQDSVPRFIRTQKYKDLMQSTLMTNESNTDQQPQ